jgi:hypothetical protein
VIGKVLRSSGSTGGLVRYLFSAGRKGEHVAPRLIAGWDDPAGLDPLTGGTRRDFRRLVALLDAPNRAAGATSTDKSIYHVILASDRGDPSRGLPPDRPLTDEDWAAIAKDTMRRTGLLGNGVGRDVRWIALRHDQPGAEHAHLIATLATEDGRRVNPRNDFYRVGEACRSAEDRYGLRVTAPRDRTSTPPLTRAEREKAQRRGTEPARQTLRREVRAAVAEATSIESFLDRLRDAGLLVRERHSERNPGDVTGYAVAVPGRGDRDGKPIYFGGGKLAADLTLPKLRARWPPAATPPAAAARSAEGTTPGQPVPSRRPTLTPQERAAVWDRALDAANRAAQIIADHAADPAGAAAAAWEAADFLASATRLVDGRRGGELTAAAEDYARAAREAWGRTPPPSTAGSGLRAAGGLLIASRVVQRGELKALLGLLAQLAVLSDSVARMRENQQRAAQAAAARSAAEQLREMRGRRAAAGAEQQARATRRVVADDEQQRGPRAATPSAPSQHGSTTR